jgi:alkylation response protein AidB-like acyl-CoA dehydrogenase
LEHRITTPDDPALDALCARLAEAAPRLEQLAAWPADQLRWCAKSGVHEWFIPRELGGQGWTEAELLRGYIRLAAACLTTTFVLTQRTGAMSRIAAGASDAARSELLPGLLSGQTFATVAISHLTTSRQHLAQPVMRALERAGGWVLSGYSPWVTGAEFAQHIVLGATLADGEQILVALPTGLPGVRIERSPQLLGLSASRTGPVYCDSVELSGAWLLAGPMPNVMHQGRGTKTGGLQTSSLAIGLASAAIDFLRDQAVGRAVLAEPAAALAAEREELTAALLNLADEGSDGPCSRAGAKTSVTTGNDLRQRANSLALRAAQATLAAAKGAGYVAGHPAGRWCKEALFFLVWSCPQPVLQANLCELAGIQE